MTETTETDVSLIEALDDYTRDSEKTKMGPIKTRIREGMGAEAYDARPTLFGQKGSPGNYSPFRFMLFWVCAIPHAFGWGDVRAVPATVRESISRCISLLIVYSETTQLRAGTFNERGGSGKTPVATAVAAIIAWATQQFVLLFDAHQAKGTAAGRLGAKGSMTMRQAMEEFKNTPVVSYSALIRFAKRHPMRGYGSLRVIDSDEKDDQTPVKIDDVLEVMEKLDDTDHSTITDTGNSTSDPTIRAAFSFTVVPIFVARLAHEDCVNICKQNRDTYRVIDPEKVDRSVLVILAHEESRRWRKRATVEQYAEAFGMPVDRVFPIPPDVFYKVTSLKGRDVNEDGLIDEADTAEALDAMIKLIMAEKLKPKTLLAYLRLIVKLFELQAEADEARLKLEEAAAPRGATPQPEQQDDPVLHPAPYVSLAPSLSTSTAPVSLIRNEGTDVHTPRHAHAGD